MAWVEQTNRRSQKAKHFYDATTNQWMAEFRIDDVHYHTGLAWEDVDESLVDDGADGFAKKCGKTRHAIRIGNGGTQRWYPRALVTGEYVSITAIEYWQLPQGRWRAINLPAATWKQQGAEWDLTNLHAELTNTWRTVKTSFILKNSTAPTRLRFALTLVGLTLDTSDWSLTSTTDGQKWGFIPPPRFTDANESDVPVTTTWAGGYLEWSLDPTGYTYPLTSHSITFVDGYGGDVNTAKDNTLYSAAAENNYGTLDKIYINAGNVMKQMLEFDLSSIAATATCDSATMYQYHAVSSGSSAFTLTIYSIASGNAAWVEGTKNGARAGAGEPCWEALAADGSGGVTTAWAGSAGASTSGTDYEASSIGSVNGNTGDAVGTEYVISLDTTRVAGWFGASNTNYGIVGFANTNGNSNCSAEHATTGYRPKLVVVYTEAATTLTVADVAHAHALDAVVLGVEGGGSSTLTVNDVAHAHALDAVVLGQLHNLAVADIAHAHTLDALVLVKSSDLVVADVAHAHSLEGLVLSQDHNLILADLAHGHALDALVLVYAPAGTLVVADLAHAHALEGVVLGQFHNLTTQDIAHANALDALALAVAHNLVLADISHAHNLDGLALSVIHNLLVQDAAHAHSLESAILSQMHNLVVSDMAHAHTLDPLTLVLAGLVELIVDDIAHGHTLEAVILYSLVQTLRVYAIPAEDRDMAIPHEDREVAIS